MTPWIRRPPEVRRARGGDPQRGLAHFCQVGRALLSIQETAHRAADMRRSRSTSRSAGPILAHAYRQIEAAKVVDILSPIGELPLPANEAQARELAPLVDDPDAVRAVWAETVQDGDGRITARMVREHDGRETSRCAHQEADGCARTRRERGDNLSRMRTSVVPRGRTGRSLMARIWQICHIRYACRTYDHSIRAARSGDDSSFGSQRAPGRYADQVARTVARTILADLAADRTQSIIVAGESRMQLPMYRRFLDRPLAAPLQTKPLGAPAILPTEYAGTRGKNTRSSAFACPHGMPHEVTRY